MLHSGRTADEGPGGGGNGNGHRSLGQLLIEEAGLSPEQLAVALDRQQFLAARHRYYLLGRILISLGHVNAHQVNAALALQKSPGPAAEFGAGPGGPAARQTARVSETWQVPTSSGPVRPLSALGVLDGLAEKTCAGDLETMSPVPLGFDPLDEVLGGGIRPGELILLGGGQGVGKTTMAFQMARNVAASGEASCLYVCYEHDEEALAQRVIAMESVDPCARELRAGVTVRDLTQRILAAHRRGNVALFDLLEADPRTGVALQRLRRYGDRLHLLKGSGARTTLTATAALVEAHRVRSDERLVLFVDYLQKMPVLPEPRTEQERMGKVVTGLKELAMAQQVPVLAVVASDREGLRAKRMRAHHFLGGSLLAYEADVILMLADKYDVVARVHIEFNPEKAHSFHDWVVCSVEKNRSGRDVVDMQFEKLFSYSCLNPNGSYVTEKLIDDRAYVE
ncbi:MAG: DnaB-like helicase C-terminal domain-containing protein [Chloroflexota bacterium]